MGAFSLDRSCVELLPGADGGADVRGQRAVGGARFGLRGCWRAADSRGVLREREPGWVGQAEGVDQRAQQAAGACALTWQAHELSYGIRQSELAPLTRGEWVVGTGAPASLLEGLPPPQPGPGGFRF